MQYSLLSAIMRSSSVFAWKLPPIIMKLHLHWPSSKDTIICWELANLSASFSSHITLFTLTESLMSFLAPKLIGLPDSWLQKNVPIHRRSGRRNTYWYWFTLPHIVIIIHYELLEAWEHVLVVFLFCMWCRSATVARDGRTNTLAFERKWRFMNCSVATLTGNISKQISGQTTPLRELFAKRWREAIGLELLTGCSFAAPSLPYHH